MGNQISETSKNNVLVQEFNTKARALDDVCSGRRKQMSHVYETDEETLRSNQRIISPEEETYLKKFLENEARLAPSKEVMASETDSDKYQRLIDAAIRKITYDREVAARAEKNPRIKNTKAEIESKIRDRFSLYSDENYALHLVCVKAARDLHNAYIAKGMKFSSRYDDY